MIAARIGAAVAGVAVAAIALSGCTPAAPVVRPTSSATASATPSPTAVAVAMPADLGPAPAPDVLSDAELDRLRLETQEQDWASVVAQFPDAVRPTVTFAGYITGPDDTVAVMEPCLTAFGIALEHGSNEDGEITSVGPAGDSELDALARFTCSSEHPVKPQVPMNVAQKEWLYRYLTEFLAPCYAANGIENPPPPARADFVTQWPDQNWWPSMGELAMGVDEDRAYAVNTACPPPK